MDQHGAIKLVLGMKQARQAVGLSLDLKLHIFELCKLSFKFWKAKLLRVGAPLTLH